MSVENQVDIIINNNRPHHVFLRKFCIIILICMLVVTVIVVPFFDDKSGLEIMQSYFSATDEGLTASAAWWDSDWDYYKTIEVADKIESYQMKILIDYDDDYGGNVSCEGNCNANFSDIRFVYNNATELPYWIENTTSASQSTFWVNNSGNYSSFEMFYGNSAVGNVSDGNATFDFYEDWASQSIDSKWDIKATDGGTAYSTTDAMHGYVQQLYGDAGNVRYYFVTNEEWGTNYCVRFRAKYEYTTAENQLMLGGWERWGGNGGCQFRQYRSEHGLVLVEEGSDGTQSRRASILFNDEAYHIFEITRGSVNTNAYVDGTLDNSEDLTPHTDQGLTWYCRDSEEDLYTDWIVIRKYRDTEPSWSSFSSEQPEIINNKPWESSPSPSNSSTDISLQPTLSIYVNDTDGDTMDITWYEGNYTSLTEVDNWDNIHATQGVCTNDTYLWATDTTWLNMTWKSNGTLKTSHDTTSDGNYGTHNGDCCFDGTYIYIATTNYPTNYESETNIYWANNLTYKESKAITGEPYWYAGVAYSNNSFWAIWDGDTASAGQSVWRSSTSDYSSYTEYDLTYSITDAPPELGYQGGTWYGNDIFLPIHSGTTTPAIPCVDRYHWNGSGFEEVRRYQTGNVPADCTQGIDYYNGYFYIAQRFHPASPQSGVTKCELTGWNEIQQNNTVNNGTYTCEFNNATIYNHTYYWRVVVDDGTDTNESWYSFTTEEAPNVAPTLSGESPTNTSTGIDVTPSLYVTCTDIDAGDTMNATWRSNSSGAWVDFATNLSISTGTNITQDNNNFSEYSTTYWWSINLTDGILWTNETYHFTTGAANTAPVLSNENPSNNTITIAVDTDLSITIEDPEGDTFNYSWSCSDGSSGNVNSESNGTKTLTLDANLATCTVYTWWVNATDGNDSVNESYSFTTFCPTVPADGYTLSWNETLTTLCVDLVDAEGDGMVYEIRQNDVVIDNGGTHVYTNTTHNFTDIINNFAHWESGKSSMSSGIALTDTTEFTSSEYQNISSVNGSGVNTSDCSPAIWSHHNFSFDLSSYDIRDITGLEVRWYGYGGYYTGGAKPKWNWGTTMYFDTDGVGWYTADSTTPFTTDDWSPVEEWINYSAHHEMEDWIDDDGFLNVAVEHTSALDCSVIYTDYIELIVTTISGGVGNGTYCTANVSWWNDTCGTDWSWVVYVTDGHGTTSTTTYTFSNAPCTFSGTVYPASGATGVCPCSDALCVDVTASYNFNMTVYGRSQYETNYTIWDKHVNISADEYCFCLCGYIIDGWHQPMRYNTTYYWYVNVSKFDNSSLYNQTDVFSFTTAEDYDDCVASVAGGGGRGNYMGIIGLCGLFAIPISFILYLSLKKRKVSPPSSGNQYRDGYNRNYW